MVRECAEIWRDADKIAFSSSLTDVSTARTRIERKFAPEAIRRLEETSGSDLSIGGAGIAAEAFRHGLVEEWVLLLGPVLVGGGKPALPRGLRLDLQLLDHRRFDNGVIDVRHAVRTPPDTGDAGQRQIRTNGLGDLDRAGPLASPRAERADALASVGRTSLQQRYTSLTARSVHAPA